MIRLFQIAWHLGMTFHWEICSTNVGSLVATLGPCVISLEESPTVVRVTAAPPSYVFPLLELSDLLLITGYVIRCG